MQNSSNSVKERGYFTEMLKAIAIAMIITFLLVLLSALIIKVFNVSSSYISIFNQVIKGLAIFLSALICLKGKSGGLFVELFLALYIF